MKILVTVTARTVNQKLEEKFLFWRSAEKMAKKFLEIGFDCVEIKRGKRREVRVPEKTRQGGLC
jgi:hypothetical protein